MKKFFRLVSMLAVAGLTFTYTSCTDYSDDIDANKESIDAVSGRLATAEQQIESLKTDVSNLQTAKSEAEKAIAALKTSLTDLQTKYDADVKALKEEYAKADDAVKADLQKKIDALTKTHSDDVAAVNNLITNLSGKVTTIEGQITTINDTIKTLATKTDVSDAKKWVEANYATKQSVTDVLTTVGGLSTTLSAVESKVNALDGKYDKDVKISEILAKITTAQAAADSAEAHARKALGNVDALKKALGVYAENGKLAEEISLLKSADSKNAADINALLERYKADSTATAAELAKKFNSADFQDTFDAALKAAVKADGIVGKAISDSLSAARTKFESEISALKTEVEGKFAKVYSVIANKIQSIVFVPEYGDMNATLHYYYIKNSADKVIPFSDTTKIVDATFEVYPAKLAGTIQKEDVSVVAVNVATRAAAAVAGEIVDFKTDAATGRVSVTVKFGKKVSYDPVSKKSFAISLRVNEDTKETVNGNEYETGNYVESSFVGVSLSEDSDLTGKYLVYNKTSKSALASEVTCQTEKQWSEAPAAWNPFEGYDFYIKLGTDTLTIAEAAAKLNLAAAELTPTFANNPTFTPVAGKAYFKHAAKNSVKTLGDLTTEMVKDKVINADGTVVPAAVNSVCQDVATATVKGVRVFKATTTYKIGRRKVTMTIDPYTVNWSYGTAVKLSSDKTAVDAYDTDIDAATLNDELLKELKVNVEGEVEGLDIKKVVDGVAPTAKHTLNGKPIPALAKVPDLEVDPVAIVNAHLATIKISGGTYEFGKAGVANVYTLCNTYANNATYTDVDVKMTLTLGSLPNPVKVEIPEQKINYEPKVVLHKLTDAATVESAFNQAGVKPYFKNLAEFKNDFLNGNETSVKSQRTNAKPVVDCEGGYTYFKVTDRVLAGGVPFIRLSQADLTSYKDTFAFETKVETWYGVTYSFATTASLEEPVYGLIYHEDLVDMTKEIPTVKISGTKDSGAYLINTDDLNKYFGIEKCNAEVADYLKIKYEYVTPLANEEWANKGYENIPALPAEIDGASGDVKSDGSLAVRDITWGDYTARDMVIKAVLTCNGVEVNSLKLKLTIDDPIAEVSIEDIAVKRSPYADVLVKLWQTTTVKSILSDANQVNQAADTKAAMWNWNADTAYDLKLTYDKNYTVFVNGKDVTAQFPASKLVFDADEGTILYKKDAAYQANDVIVEVTAYLTHKFNYNNKNAEELHKNTYKFNVVISE